MRPGHGPLPLQAPLTPGHARATALCRPCTQGLSSGLLTCALPLRHVPKSPSFLKACLTSGDAQLSDLAVPAQHRICPHSTRAAWALPSPLTSPLHVSTSAPRRGRAPLKACNRCLTCAGALPANHILASPDKTSLESKSQHWY